MNHVKHWFLVAALCVSATACMGNPDNDSESTDQQGLSTTGAPELQQWNSAIKNTQPDKTSDKISPAVDCAFIEWCNRPASISPDIGTVCRVRTGCSLTQAVVNECTSEANSVCGGMTQPAFICAQGGSCP